MLPLIARFAAARALGGSTGSPGKASIKRQTFNIDRRIEKLEREFQKIKDEAHKKFVQETPIDTGNARRSTDLRGNEIQANYDYSVKLQNGYSRQAPDGMTDPTIEHVRKFIKRI